jgi:DNA-binding CsgD family transcriptional regulator
MSARRPAATHGRGPAAAALVTALQAVAALFFVADAAGDVRNDGWSGHVAMEAFVALALVAGVVTGALQLRRMLAEAARREAALSVAQGALAEVLAARFAGWGLTPAEADVATFALKGCDIAEIAALRGAAPGTVRAQLAAVYAKSGVTSRAAFASLFIEDLLGEALPGIARRD